MATSNPIGLRIPEQTLPSDEPFYLSDKKVVAWAKELPMANTGETSRQIFQSLRAFNRTRIPAKQRLQSVEYFREPLAYVASNLNKHYLGTRFPLSEKSHKVANLNRELHSGIATAYKAVIVDLLTSQQGAIDRTMLTQAIHRCITYLAKALLHSVIVYDPYPKRIWHELHVLHRLARRYDIGSTPVSDNLEPMSKQTTIDQNYIRCLLFSIASPYKMRQKENIQIFDTLIEWSKHTNLHNYEEAPEESSITIRQDRDHAPSHETLVNDAETKYLLVLETSKLLTLLREHFTDTQDPSKSLPGIKELDKGVIRQIIMLWSKAQKRAFVRTKLNFELRIAVGLRSVHKLITIGNIPPNSASKIEEENSATWIDTQFAHGNELNVETRFSLQPMDIASYNPRRGNFEEFGPNTTDFNEIEDEPNLEIWQDDKSDQLDKATCQFTTINESAGGYCLDWRGTAIPKIQVGELIGVQSAMSATQFGVGMVRWMRSSEANSMQVGIQMIAPNAVAVTAKLAEQKSKQAEKCLLLPEVGTSGQPTSLICPSYPFNLGKTLLIDDGETPREIKLTRVLESSGSISQFQFVHLDENASSKSNDDNDDLDSDSDYESLWSTLI